MFKALGLSMLLSFSGAVFAGGIADSHTEMSGCEACHEDGAPSDDGAFENEACASCHGPLKELDSDVHKNHEGAMLCNDCHVVHEEALAKDSCSSCH